MSQPKWKFLVNVGDVNPLDHGGMFVYVDETGVYPPEAECVWPEEDIDLITVHRFILEPCTYINGVLSDNKFHPDKWAWFAAPPSGGNRSRPDTTNYLKSIADTEGTDEAALIAMFCSDDPQQRVYAWRSVGDFFGYDNLDSQPIKLTRVEAVKRYQEQNGVKY